MISHSTSWFGYQPKVDQFDILYNQNDKDETKLRKNVPKLESPWISNTLRIKVSANPQGLFVHRSFSRSLFQHKPL